MPFSNQTKGAISSARQYAKEPKPKTLRTIQSSELINEIVEYTHLNHTDALSAFSMMVNSIKNNLLKGNQVNLGDLGILSPCAPSGKTTPTGSTETNIKFTLSQHLKYEFQEKERLLKTFSSCQ